MSQANRGAADRAGGRRGTRGGRSRGIQNEEGERRVLENGAETEVQDERGSDPWSGEGAGRCGDKKPEHTG